MHEDLPGEEWLGLVAYPGYEVSSEGRARSYWKLGCRPVLSDTSYLLSLTPNAGGYLRFGVRRNRKPHTLLIHRLVLEAFVGPCPEGKECRHLDGDPTNNRLSNLAWGTHKENYDDSMSHGTAFLVKGAHVGESHARAKLTEPEVREIIRLRKIGHGATELGRMFGVTHGYISQITNRQVWRHLSI